jgi:transposase
VLAAEIDRIERFASAEKLCAYAGVVPTTHSSGGKVYHGRLQPSSNKWLRWALIEASWVAIGCSPYFGSLYRQQRRPREESQHHHHDRGAADVPHPLRLAQ